MRTVKEACPHRDLKPLLKEGENALELVSLGACGDTGEYSQDSYIEWTVGDEEYGDNYDNNDYEPVQLNARKRVDEMFHELGVLRGETVVIHYWW